MISSPSIFQNKQWWNTLSEGELSNYVDTVFQYYREHGYPHYAVDVEAELKRLERSGNSVLVGDVIRQKMIGLSLAWSYHPHAVSVRNGDSLSPMEVFQNDDLFRKCIEKRVRYGDNISDAAIRKSLRKYGGIGVSNFRPTSASFIYDHFQAKSVWDMCGGYGGRLLGAWLSQSVQHYVATEPCTQTYEGLQRMVQDLYRLAPKGKVFDIFQVGSEDFETDTQFDLCFTSPPYFNQERYSSEPTQSYVKYPTYWEWLNGYLRLTVQNCFRFLKPDGHLVINISNTKSCPTLEYDFLYVAQTCGFELEYTLQLELSAREHYSKDKEFKHESVFVLRKICQR